MYWITLDQITCFHTLYTEGSLQKASDRLHKAKSAISYSINNLEKQLGFPLLDKSAYRSTLTPQGEAFLYKSQKLLREMSELQAHCKLIASEVEMKLSLSVSGIFDMSLLYPIIGQAMHQFPATEIILEREMLSGEKMLRREMVDMAIFENLHLKREVEYKCIGQVQLILVIAAEHPFLQLPVEAQTLEALYQYPQIVQRSTIQEGEYDVGVHHQSLKWRVTDTPSKKEIIMNGLGWGRMPTHTVDSEIQDAKLVHLSHLEDDDEVEVFLCKRAGQFFGKVAQFIWDAF